MDNAVTLPMLAEIVLVSAKTVVREDRPPFPSELIAVFIIFGGAGLLGAWDPRVGAVFGWGVVVATALNVMPFITAGSEES